MSASRDELRRLVDELPDEQVPKALAYLKRRARRRGSWRLAGFGNEREQRRATAAKADQLGHGFDRFG